MCVLFPLWRPHFIYNPVVFWNLLHIGNKTDCSPIVYISAFYQIKVAYSTHMPIFTDGLKDKSTLAVFFPSELYSQKLSHNKFVYTAELIAIKLALLL